MEQGRNLSVRSGTWAGGELFSLQGGGKSISLFLTPEKTSSGNEKQKEQVLGVRGVPAGWQEGSLNRSLRPHPHQRDEAGALWDLT